MSRESAANRIYEQRVVIDSLARLAKRIDLKELPLTAEELLTLARRSREAFHGSERKRERLAKYREHLAKSHGADAVQAVSSALEEINNEIGWEEK